VAAATDIHSIVRRVVCCVVCRVVVSSCRRVVCLARMSVWSAWVVRVVRVSWLVRCCRSGDWCLLVAARREKKERRKGEGLMRSFSNVTCECSKCCVLLCCIGCVVA